MEYTINLPFRHWGELFILLLAALIHLGHPYLLLSGVPEALIKLLLCGELSILGKLLLDLAELYVRLRDYY